MHFDKMFDLAEERALANGTDIFYELEKTPGYSEDFANYNATLLQAVDGGLVSIDSHGMPNATEFALEQIEKESNARVAGSFHSDRRGYFSFGSFGRRKVSETKRNLGGLDVCGLNQPNTLRKIAAGAAVGIFAAAAGAALLTGEADAIAPVHPYEKIYQSDYEIEHLAVSPDGEKLFFQERDVYGTNNRYLKEMDLNSGRIETLQSSDSWPWSFKDNGNLIFESYNGPTSTTIKERTDSGITTLLSSDDFIFSSGFAGGKLFYTKYNKNSNGSVESTIFSKIGSGTPSVVYKSNFVVRESEISEDGSSIAFLESSVANETYYQDHLFKVMRSDGSNQKTLLTASSDYNNPLNFDFDWGFGKLAWSFSQKGGSKTYFADSNGFGNNVLLSSAQSKNLMWINSEEISYNDYFLGVYKQNIDGSAPENLFSDDTPNSNLFGWYGKDLYFSTIGKPGEIYKMGTSKITSYENRAPRLGFPNNSNLLPTATVGKKFYLDFNATDADNDPLTFSDDTNLFNINPQTGIIDWTPRPSDVGTHFVNISVSDGKSSDSYEMEINVSPAGGIIPSTDKIPPTILSVRKEFGVGGFLNVDAEIADNVGVNEAYVVFNAERRQPLFERVQNGMEIYSGTFKISGSDKSFRVYADDKAGNVGSGSLISIRATPDSEISSSTADSFSFIPYIAIGLAGAGAAGAGIYFFRKRQRENQRFATMYDSPATSMPPYFAPHFVPTTSQPQNPPPPIPDNYRREFIAPAAPQPPPANFNNHRPPKILGEIVASPVQPPAPPSSQIFSPQPPPIIQQSIPPPRIIQMMIPPEAVNDFAEFYGVVPKQGPGGFSILVREDEMSQITKDFQEFQRKKFGW